MSARPSLYVQGVIVSPRVAAVLESMADFQAARTKYRGTDDEVYDTLHALRYAALQWAAYANESRPAPGAKAEPALKRWYTPEQIAGQLHVTPAAIRLAIREGRLPAEKNDGRWRITPADYSTYRSTRATQN
jgi:hypothetical protein